MAKRTFDNETLAKVWAEDAGKNGTRNDVVTALMGVMGLADEGDNRRKVYNNVTQRVKNLETVNGVVFPPLTEGKKGTRKSVAEVDALKAILATVPAKTEETKAPEGGEQAPAPEGQAA